MKKFNNRLITVLFFVFVFACYTRGQQHKTSDTVQLKEVIIPSSFPIDTIIQKILFVFERQPIKDEPCEDLGFIVLYNDFKGIRFEMGGIRNIYSLYWVYHQDSIIFFSSSIYNKIKDIKKSDQIEKYLLDHGERHDCLIQDTLGYYWSLRKNLLFKKEDELSNCKLKYYNSAIGK